MFMQKFNKWTYSGPFVYRAPYFGLTKLNLIFIVRVKISSSIDVSWGFTRETPMK